MLRQFREGDVFREGQGLVEAGRQKRLAAAPSWPASLVTSMLTWETRRQKGPRSQPADPRILFFQVCAGNDRGSFCKIVACTYFRQDVESELVIQLDDYKAVITIGP